MRELEQQSSVAPRESLPPGSILGERYEIVRSVAAGGFGAVYEARHIHAQRKVAVKVLHAWLAADHNTVERFRRELQAPAQIDHPGIVDVLDADIDARGVPFLVMEWLEGQTLRERMRGGPLSLTELRDVFAPFLDALDAAHAGGFVHRDLKPENCILERTPDGAERTRIVDFGLARKTGMRSVTVTGTSLGTPRYMSPEQFMDAKAVGPPADVWSVGSMMYEALCGHPPFRAKAPHALMLKILTEAHPPVREVLPDIPPRLAALIEACLDKEAANRPADAHMLRSRFLGVYAAMSGGVNLRTIPEMAATGPNDIAAAKARAEAQARRPVQVSDAGTLDHRRRAPAEPAPAAAPAAPSFAGHVIQAPDPVIREMPQPAPLMRTTPMAGFRAPQAPHARRDGSVLLLAGGAVLAVGFVAAIGIGVWALNRTTSSERSRPASTSDPASPVAPVEGAPLAPLGPMQPHTEPAPPSYESGEIEDYEEEDYEEGEEGEGEEEGSEEGGSDEGPLRPITRPLDGILFP